MNSQFKFPHRVRIHGGECGAVARALHHKVENFSTSRIGESLQYDKRKESNVTKDIL
jgi:hypothetical protein